MPIEILLLLGLPASGKSEIRTYLDRMPHRVRLAEVHMGAMVHVDDFPYVWAMRSIDAELAKGGHPPLFFEAADRPFLDARDWCALTVLAAEDQRDFALDRVAETTSPGGWLLDRIESARRTVGIGGALHALPGAVRDHLEHALLETATPMLGARRQRRPAGHPTTFVIELARGGPESASPPLPAPLGYAHSLPWLGKAVLSRARVLHVAVSAAESRRRNRARADAAHPGSILGHSVPDVVMRHDYGCDDLGWLARASGTPHAVRISVGVETIDVPIARFDNEDDVTSFIRRRADTWSELELGTLRDRLTRALGSLATGPDAQVPV